MKRFGMRIVLCLLLALSLFGLVTKSNAQSRSVVLERRDAIFTLHNSNLIDVEETWVVRFNGGPFRSATRTIPLNRVDDITNWSVSRAGKLYEEGDMERSDTYYVERTSGQYTIKWFFAQARDETLTFTLRYQLVGAMQVFAGGDQFYWTFIEADRAYPINSARAEVRFPSDLPPTNVLSASYLDKEQNGTAQQLDARTLLFTSTNIRPNQGWELRAQVPHGFLQLDEPAWQWRERMQPVFGFYAMLAAGLITLIGFLALILRWLRARKPWSQVHKSEFRSSPPEGMLPTAAGLLLEDKLMPRHVIALLIDMTRRGQITLEKTKRGIELRKVNDDFSDLSPFERTLMEGFFRTGNTTTIQANGGLYNRFRGMEPEWQRYLVTEGYYKTSPEEQRSHGRSNAIVCAVAAFIAAWAAWYFFSDYTPLIWMPFMALSLVCAAYAFFAPALVVPSKKGAQAISDLLAFQRYLAQIKNYTEIAKAKEQFGTFLPYAVAFDLEESWIETFAAAKTPAPVWYAKMATSSSDVERANEQERSNTSIFSSSSPSRSNDSSPIFLGGLIGSSDSEPSSPSASDASRSGPTLDFDRAASGAFSNLNLMSSGFFSMLNETTRSFHEPFVKPSSFAYSEPRESSWGLSSSNDSSDSSWSSSSSSSWSSSSSDSGGGWSSSSDSGGGGSSSFD
jgi:uncharacterized membrane protein YgcG